ncbi:MAG: 50S ribosomal protein L18 [Chloroflexi bacterium]|nr:50S ribosomal protein L18 [Chloroflexota bacterium]
MVSEVNVRKARKRRHLRVRKRVEGIAQRPRLAVFRSLQHIYAQVIDDTQQRTITAASSLDREIRDQTTGLRKTERAALVGTSVAKRALAAGVEQVAFDRGGFRYHGRVKALAEAARKAGLAF